MMGLPASHLEGRMSNMKKDWPQWKSWLWRFLRTGLAGSAGAVGAVVAVVKLDLSNPKVWSSAILSAIISGFVAAIALAGRDTFGDQDKSEGIINKLPL